MRGPGWLADVCTTEPGRTLRLECCENVPGHVPPTDTGTGHYLAQPSQPHYTFTEHGRE